MKSRLHLASQEALIMPVHLEPDSTWVLLDDFHAWTGLVDSVVWENGTALRIQPDPLSFPPSSPHHSNRPPKHLDIWNSGRPTPPKPNPWPFQLLRSAKQIRPSEPSHFTESIQAASIIGGFTGWQSQPPSRWSKKEIASSSP